MTQRDINEFWEPPVLAPEDDRLVMLYREFDIPLDALPYTPEFDQLVQRFTDKSPERSLQHEVFRRLLTLRKKGRLPRVAGVRSRSPG